MPETPRQNGLGSKTEDFATAREDLLRLTRRGVYATLATTSPDGQPSAAPLRYAVTDAFEIVMGTLGTSRKFATLHHNPKVAVPIWDFEHSIQIEGTFDLPAGPELERLQSEFAKEFPREMTIRQGRAAHRFFRITPHWVRYTDFTCEPGLVSTLDLARQTATRGTWPVVAE